MHQDATGLRPSPLRETRAAHRHRVDLDGLRGLAIALVVVFHIWFGRVSGGVDVFLVLSGFFFTTMVVRRIDDGGPRAVGRIAVRTARRLLPAYVVVLAAVAAWTVWSRPFTMWDATASQVLASLTYLQNWELALTSADYAAADASVSTLQHLWSMSVQVQFYLAVVAVCVVLRSRRALVAALAVVTVVSFGYAAHLGATHQGWAYYDTGARLWELTAGALLGLTVHRLTLPARARRVCAVVGLAALLLCGVIVDGASSFPGPAALLPVGAAVALILAGAGVSASDAPAVTRFLSTRPLLFLGEIAYPLYLWHWPVLIFYLEFRGHTHVGVVGGLVVVAISMAATLATRAFVETPMTGARAPRTLVIALVTAAAVLVTSSIAWQSYVAGTTQSDGPPDQLDSARYPGALALTDGAPVPDAPMRPTVLDAESDLPPSSFDGCISDMTNREVISCEYGDLTADRTLAVAGSSHAEHWLTALDQIGRDRGVRVVSFLKMGCPLNLGEPLLGDQPYPDCRDWSDEVLTRLGEEQPEWVFTTATRPSSDSFGDVTPVEYQDVWTRFDRMGLNVLALRDTPWLSRDGVPYRPIDCIADGGDGDSCGLPRFEVLSDVNPALAASEPFPTVTPVDLSDAVCGIERCDVVVGNVLVYHDSHHLSASYVRTLSPVLDRAIGDTTGWW